MLVKVSVGKLNWRDLWVDSQRDHVVINQLADFVANVFAQLRAVLVAIPRQGMNIGQLFGVVHELQCFRTGQDIIQCSAELF